MTADMRSLMNKPIRTLLTALFPLALVACDTSEAPEPEAHAEAPIETGIIVTDWQQQSLEQFEQAAAHWQQALVNLEQNKDEKNLAALRQSLADWYHRFTEQAPLLNARACQLNQQAILARMDTWPLYPGYIDSMPEWPESGLISDPYLELNRKNLRIQHGATDSAEASLGFAAMLVVLNGTGETAKPLAFFQDEAQQAPRRLTYLKLAGEQILADYRTFATEVSLVSSDLDCALSAMLERRQQLISSTDNDSELVIPNTIRKTLSDIQLNALQNLPESVVSAWEDVQPGIMEAITSSKNKGWKPIEEWQGRTSE